MKSCIQLTVPLAIALLTACATPALTPKATHAVPTVNTPKKLKPPTVIDDSSLATPIKQAEQGLLNISVHDLNAREFFMGLMLDSKENIVVHPDVAGVISLELKNVNVEQVLNVVQKVYGYDCQKTDMGYLVYPATLQTKMFKLDRLDLLREGRSNTLVVSGQNNNQNNNNQNSQNNSQSNSQSNNSFSNNNSQGVNPQGNSQQSSQASGSWVRTTSNTDFWQELDEALQVIIAVDPQAKVIANKQSGVIIARAKPMQLQEIDRFLATMQNQIGRQVILEAKILEVILDNGHQDGVNWDFLIKNGAFAGGMLTGFGTPDPSKFASTFTLGTRGGDFGSNFSALVEMLETQGKTNVLSSPRIATLNNQKAIIKVGRDEYFVTGISASSISTVNSIGGVTSSALPTAILNSFFSGIALDVTPQIDDHNDITLHIHPSITKVENLDKNFKIYNADYSLPTALNTVRESDSIVKAHDGQLIVLGGLMQERSDETKEGLTGLARLPYVGNLFRVNKGTTQKSELIIMLKASIISGDSNWQQQINDNQQHFNQLNAQPRWK
ncbi:MAG: secretin N-terminal domain-containing protein [Methylococcaceae bacterium]